MTLISHLQKIDYLMYEKFTLLKSTKMPQLSIKQNLHMKLRQTQALELIIKVTHLKIMGINKEETEKNRLCSLYPYHEPGTSLWLDKSKDSEMNQREREERETSLQK